MVPFVMPVNLLIEGDTDQVIVRRILEYAGLPCGRVYGKRGKPYVLERLPKYNQAARFSPWLTVVDLNQDAECAPDFVRSKLSNPAPGMHLRVAVHAIEAWLLADREGVGAFLGIGISRIPVDPDREVDPKTTVINLARRSSRKFIRQDMVPREGSGARVGPGYTGRLIEFVTRTQHPWRPEVAIERSDSLRRCVEALQSLRARDPAC